MREGEVCRRRFDGNIVVLRVMVLTVFLPFLLRGMYCMWVASELYFEETSVVARCVLALEIDEEKKARAAFCFWCIID